MKAAWAGIAGPVLFAATFTLEGFMRPGYEAQKMFVSELSLGPRGAIQIVNFIVFGALLVAFAWSVARELGTGKASRAGPVLLAIMGVCLIASGIFSMDPVTSTTYRTSPPLDQLSLHAKAHGIFGALFFTLAPVICFVFLWRFRVDARWRSMVGWSVAAVAIIAVDILIMRIGPTRPPHAPNVLNEWCGALQRVAIGSFLIWLFRFAVSLQST